MPAHPLPVPAGERSGRGERVAVHLARGHGQDHALLLVDGARQLVAVEHQERFHRDIGDALIPVDERVVLDKRESEGRRLSPTVE